MQLTINSKLCTFRAGMTIYEVAREQGVFIPVLCRHEDLRPRGACRVCVVEVTGAPALVASCSHPASDGMVIETDSDAVRFSRRITVELLLAQGRHDCTVCGTSESCVLRRIARELDIEGTQFHPLEPAQPPENSAELIVYDSATCIMCGLCVQACNELQVNNAIDFIGRGPAVRVGPAPGMGPAGADCVMCGECVRLCPVGAMRENSAGVEPSADPVRSVRTTCPYCGVGCQMDLQVRHNRIVGVATPRVGAPPPNHGSLCVKGRFGCDHVSHPDRLATAFVRREGLLVPAGCDEAIALAAQRLAAIRQEYGPDAIAGLASARCTNEDNYLFQKFFRSVIGTNNIDHCARLCHSPSVAGLATVFGSGAMTNSIADIELADCILVTGSNTTENHPVIGAVVKRAVALRGASLIVADPRGIPLTRHAHVWLRPRPGSDIAWINGLAHVILQEGLADEEFIRQRTDNIEAFRAAVAAYTPQHVRKLTGIEPDDLIAAARLYGRARRASVLYAMGITQHTCGTDTVRALANLALVTGNIGREGSGLNPLRGQNNVQGACDMGCLPNLLPGYRSVTEADAVRVFEQSWGCRLPAVPGLTVPEMLDRACDGSLKALFIMGENPMLSEPDSAYVKAALAGLDLLVCQDIFLNETGRLAHVVLPAASWAEKDGTFTSTERRVQRVRKALAPPGQARADWSILSDLARDMGASWSYASAEGVFEEMRTLMPQYRGITYARIATVGLQWPCPGEDHPGTPVLHTQNFVRGRALFSVVDASLPAEMSDEQYPFVLTTGRILYHYHTATMSGRSRGLSSRADEAFVEINPADAEVLGIEQGHRVRVQSRRGAIEVSACITRRCARGVVFVPFHYSEAAANVLTSRALDPEAHIAEVKVCAVRLDRVRTRCLHGVQA